MDNSKLASRRVQSLTKQLRRLLPLLVFIGCGYLVWLEVADTVWSDVVAATASVPLVNWFGALLATAISFWAIGRFDVILHRHFRTGIGARDAANSGRAAVAIAQTVGFGPVIGSLVRWKWLEPQISPLQAAQVTIGFTVLFLGCWSIICLAALAILDSSPLEPWLALTLASLCLSILFAVSLLQPAARLMNLRWPPCMAMTRLLGFTFVDVFAASVALWLLLPNGAGVPLAMIVPIYLMALGAGLVGATPAGLGPFEVTMLAFLPFVPEAELIAGLICFRMVYYALPATIAGIALTKRHFRGTVTKAGKTKRIPYRAFLNAQNPECRIGLDATSSQIWTGNFGWICHTTDQARIALFDPLGQPQPTNTLLETLEADGNSSDLFPALYKCDARIAAAARKRGYKVIALSADAIIDPVQFDLNTSAHRQLRRKLRKAEKSDVLISEPANLPLHHMRRVARLWAETNGGERGFSMSRFDTAPLSDQRVFTAYHAGRLVAFVTFNQSTNGWALDLMRQTNDAPDGTMHLMIAHAINVASDEGVRRLSLAAVPLEQPAKAQRGIETTAQRMILARCANSGLRQFKAAFAPRWETRYLAAPSSLALLFAGRDIAQALQPRPWQDASQSYAADQFHDRYKQNEIATVAIECEMEPTRPGA